MHLKFQLSHPWDATIEEAERIQQEFRHLVCISPLQAEKQTCITAIAAGDRQEYIIAAAVTANLINHSLEMIIGREKSVFPYHSGYMAFHQAPAIIKTLMQLNRLGDVIIVSGHGLAHPRRFGLASHLGVLLDIPSIGCAQGLLPGNELQPSDDPLIDWVTDVEGVVGIAVYTKSSKKPWALSIGHRTDVESLLTFKDIWMKNHRLPEPLSLARKLLRGYKEQI